MSWRFAWAPATYRGWAWLILGGALLMPYLMATEVLAVLFIGGTGFGSTLLLAQLPVYAVSLPLVAVTALALPRHVATVLSKLRVRDRVQAVIEAYESGFVSPR